MRTFLTLFLFPLIASLPAEGIGDEASTSRDAEGGAAVLQTVDRFFAALAAHDVAGAATILHPNGVLFSQRYPDESDNTLVHRTNVEWLEGMRRWTRPAQEHTSNSSVSVRGPVGVVWQAYRFEVDGQFSHCGVNIVSLIRTNGSWKIASIVWTVERSDCPS